MLTRLRLEASARLREAFGGNRTVDWRIVVVYLLINGLVGLNALRHDPRIGYDVEEHFDYIQALAELGWVTPDDTGEFFSPPLPYLLPALLVRAGMPLLEVGRVGLLTNTLLSLGVTWLLLLAAFEMNGSPGARLAALLFLGCLPVYYRTFAFVRGEPYLVFFATLAIYLVARAERHRTWSYTTAAALGLSLGLLALSRQSGLSFLLAVALLAAWRWFRSPELRPKVARWFGVVVALGLATGGWYYWHLEREYGTAFIFNREPSRISLRNMPAEFFFGLGGDELFTHPFRPSFNGQLIPKLYSDIWGDYWGYFSVYGKDVRTQRYLNGLEVFRNGNIGVEQGWLETNSSSMPHFLGQVNRVSLFPFLLGVAGMGYGILVALGLGGDSAGPRSTRGTAGFLVLCFILTLGGYVLALLRYPTEARTDTIKATYVLHAAPCVALLFGLLAARVRERHPRVFGLMMMILALVSLHNLPVMITHYPLSGLEGWGR